VLVLGACLLAAPLAVARPDDATTRAKTYFTAGEAHFSLGEFALALEEYRKAYLLRALPPLLFNMAQCHRQLGQLDRAAFLLRRFLASSPARAQRAHGEAVLREVEAALRSRAQAVSTHRGAASAPTSRPAEQTSHTAPLRAAATAAAPRATAADLVVPTSPAAPRSRVPLYKRWWVWTLVGGALIATATAVGVAASRGDDLPSGTLRPIDYR